MSDWRSNPAFCPYHAYKAVASVISERPLTSILVTNAATVVTLWVNHARKNGGVKKNLLDLVFSTLTAIPGAAGAVEKEQQEIVKKLEEKLIGDRDRWGIRNNVLPPNGTSEQEIVSKMREWASLEEKHWKQGQVSGGIYHGGDQLTNFAVDAFRIFALSNPLHVDVFPAIRKLDAEIVSMVSDLFGGGETVGTMSSGGTESIILAVYSAREWARETKGITAPEMIIPTTAHAAFIKAAYYFGIKLIYSDVDPVSFRADVKDIASKLTKNTIFIIGSAPSFSQGVIDPIEDLGRLALKGAGSGPIWLHVDCCLGSFVIACARDAGFPVAPFDFTVPGVTSISCDTHKYGFALKGTSVIMYRNKSFRKYQYFTATKWTGGIYATPALQGSRCGALSAACWAVMSHIGKSGYVESAKRIITMAKGIEAGIREIKDLKICGSPDLMVVAFQPATSGWSLHALADAMSKRGWNLNTLQFPSCIHIAVTLLHCSPEAAMPKRFLDDLKVSVEEAKSAGGELKGTAAIYGLAESVPEKIVSGLTTAFIDAVYTA